MTEDDLIRLPGLFRRWEIEAVVTPQTDFRIEEAGTAADGTPLFAIYHRAKRANPERNTHADRRF